MAKKKNQINNKNFVKAMNALKERQTKEREEKFQDALLHDVTFYVPMKRAGEGAQMMPAFGLVLDPQRQAFYAVFTSREEAVAWNPEPVEYALLSFRELSGMSIGDSRIHGIVIDAKGASMILGRKFISDMARMERAELEGLHAIPAKEMEFRDPQGKFEDTLDAMREYLEEDGNVSAAYLRETTIDDQETYVLLITHVLGTDPTFPNLMTLAHDFPADKPFCVMSTRSKEAGEAIKDVMPFYRRPIVVG